MLDRMEYGKAYVIDENLKQLARFIVAYMASRVLNDGRLLTSRAFVESIDLSQIQFDPEGWRSRWASLSDRTEPYPWPFDPAVLSQFQTAPLQVVS